MKNGGEASLVVNDAVFAQILGLLVGDSLERLLSLRYRNRVLKTFEILGQASLICALMEPRSQLLRITGRQLRVFCLASQLNHTFRPQNTIQVLVQQNLR